MSILVWLVPTLLALFLYGIGQGLVKKYSEEIPPARFCLFFVLAKAVVNLGYYFSQGSPAIFTAENMTFSGVGTFAYILDGAAWILYFESIVAGPITIVGTLSAAYPALTVLFAWWFLGESLSVIQYVGVGLLIVGCIGLSYSPPAPGRKATRRRWIFLAASALVMWGAAQTFVKYAYTLPGATDGGLALLNTVGGMLTLGIFGWMFGRTGNFLKQWAPSFVPMAMMAGGDLGVIVATQKGPVSVVTPLSGAYPVVTLGFAWVILKERLTPLQWFFVGLVLSGMFLGPGFK